MGKKITITIPDSAIQPTYITDIVEAAASIYFDSEDLNRDTPLIITLDSIYYALEGRLNPSQAYIFDIKVK